MDLTFKVKSLFRSLQSDNLLQTSTTELHEISEYAFRKISKPTAFRILALDPGRDDDPLQGELIDADIQSPRCPSFVTLSYVWGMAKYERPFLCRSGAKSGKILITASLEQALKRFRLRHGTLYIWTDGVCIDQMNMEERNQQVKLMGQIYRSADQVIVWLGNDDKNYAEEAFKQLKKGKDLEVFAKHAGPETWVDRGTVQVLSAVNELVQCDYFQRVWVIQEAILGKKALVYWGSEQIEFVALSKGLDWVLTTTELGPIHGKAGSWVRAISQRTEKGFELFQVFGWIRTRQCADDRDRVYGILGLPYVNDYPWYDCLVGLEPQYNISISTLYLDVACRAIKKEGLAHLLNAIHHGPELAAWQRDSKSSWVPQWNEDFSQDLKIIEPNNKIGKITVQSIDEKQKIVRVECIRVDEIVSFSQNDLLLPSYDRNIDSIFEFWSKQVVGLASSKDPSDSAWVHLQFCDVFGAQLWPSTKKASLWKAKEETVDELRGARLTFSAFHWEYRYQELSEATKLALTRMLQVLHESRRACVKRIWELDRNRQHIKTGYWDGFVREEWLEDYKMPQNRPDQKPKEKLRGRRLFLTQRGQLGLGPEAMRAGDNIVI